MRRPFVLLLLLAGLVSLSSEEARAQSAVEMVLAGVRVGKDSDVSLTARYGPGFVVPSEGPAGARYFTDASHSYTMIATHDGGGVVVTVELFEGLVRPQERRHLVRTGGHPGYFREVPPEALPRQPIPARTGSGVRLGDSPARVRQYYGEPPRETDSGGLHWYLYKTDYGHDSSVMLYEAGFGFKGEHLSRIMIFNGQ